MKNQKQASHRQSSMKRSQQNQPVINSKNSRNKKQEGEGFSPPQHYLSQQNYGSGSYQYGSGQNSPEGRGDICHTSSNDNLYQHSSPYEAADNFSQQQSPTSMNRIDAMKISGRSKALLFQQRALLEDNQKDLAYMEMISGGKPKPGHSQKQSKPQSYSNNIGNNIGNNLGNNNGNNGNKSYKGQEGGYLKKFSGQDKGGQSESERTQQYNQYRNRNQQERQAIIKPIDRSGEEGSGLTPGASKHYDGVKNLYQQEIEILKYNIWQCSQQDKNLAPSYDQKEDKLWQSFSQSPSPGGRDDLGDGDEYEGGGGGRNEEVEQPSPSRLTNVKKPENILKNETYLKLIQNKNSSSHNQSQLKSSTRSALKTPNPTKPPPMPHQQPYQQTDLSYASPSSNTIPANKTAYSAGVGGKDRGIIPLGNKGVGMQQQNEGYNKQPSDTKQSIGMPMLDEIEQLRRENDQLKYNLQKQQESKQQTTQQYQHQQQNQQQYQQQYQQQQNSTIPSGGGIFRTQDQANGGGDRGNQKKNQISSTYGNTGFSYNDKSSQNNPNNPYQRNLYNSAKKDQQNYGIAAAGSAGTQSIVENSQFVHQNKTLSPITNRAEQRDQHYESILNAEDEDYMHIKEEYSQNQNQSQDQNMSPYAKLSYFERMQKIREDRKKDVEQLEQIERERRQYQKGVLRRKNLDTQGSIKFQTPIKSKRGTGGSQHSTQLKQNKVRQQSEVQSMLQSQTSNVLQLEANNYMRKVSKYELDRGELDIDRLKREKDRERTEGNKQQKGCIDKEKEDKLMNEIHEKDKKISELSELKSKQDKERKIMVRRNQEALRRALDEKKVGDVNNHGLYLSPPGGKGAKKGSNKKVFDPTVLQNLKEKQQKPNDSAEGDFQWVSQVNVEGTPRAIDSSSLPKQIEMGNEHNSESNNSQNSSAARGKSAIRSANGAIRNLQ